MKLVHGTESLSLFGFRASFPTIASTAHPLHACLTFGFSLQTQVCLFEGVPSLRRWCVWHRGAVYPQLLCFQVTEGLPGPGFKDCTLDGSFVIFF